MNYILPLILLCITGVSEANSPFSSKKLDCPLPKRTMSAEEFRITNGGAVARIHDKTGRDWEVYIHSKKMPVNKELVNNAIDNPKNEVPREAKHIFGAWMCNYDGSLSEVQFEAISSY